MTKLLIILATVSSCMAVPPSVPLADTEYVDEWDAIVLAWEEDPTLPEVPESCDELAVALIPREDFSRYQGPGDGPNGYVTMNILVVGSDLDDATRRGTALHEMTHWLALCTGLDDRGEHAGNQKHDDARLWADLTGVRDRARDGRAYEAP